MVALTAAAMLAAMDSRVVTAQGAQDFVRETTPMPTGRHFHGSAVLGDYLYVFGGADETQKPVLATDFARINDDGTVGAWQSTTALPGPRMYVGNSTLVLNDTVYVLGGAADPVADEYFNTVLIARPGTDGRLGEWKQSPPFGRGAGTIAAVSTPGHIHAIGGLGTTIEDGKDQVLNEVWTSTVQPDGNLSTWTAGPALPVPLWYHNAAVAGGRVWVWGGLRTTQPTPGTSISNMVFSSPILADGTMGAWRREANDLPRGYYSATSAVVGPYLMAIAPRYTTAELSNDVCWATIGANGLSAWKSTNSPTMTTRLYHPTAYDYRRGLIFVAGGRESKANRVPTKQTFALVLSPEARRAGEQGWQTAEQLHTATLSASLGEELARAGAAGGGAAGGTGSLAYMADGKLSPAAPNGFVTHSTAMLGPGQRAAQPMALYFRLGGSKPTVEQETNLQSPEFANLAESATMVWIDVREQPQMAQQHGVFRVPTWLFFDSAAGMPVSRHTGVLTVEELARRVGHAAAQPGAKPASSRHGG